MKEKEKKITQIKKAMGCLIRILWSKELKKWKYNIYETTVKSALLYGVESGSVTERHKKKEEAEEMKAVR